MTAYNINKGIGREVEFHGLKAQYLFYFAGGLHGGPVFRHLRRGAPGAAPVAPTLRRKARYGTFGPPNEAARRRRPRRIVHRRDVRRLLVRPSVPFHL